MDQEQPIERQCLDCGESSEGKFCSHCGLKIHLSNSIAGYILEALPGIFGADKRFLQTIKLLAVNPGKLTRRFHEGKRKRYLSPMAMLVSSIFLLFTLPLLTQLVPVDEDIQLQEKLIDLDNIRELDQLIEEEVDAIHKSTGEERESHIEDLAVNISSRNLLAKLNDVPEIPRSRHAKILMEVEEEDETWIDRRLTEMVEKFDQNPELMASTVRSNLIKYSWALIPLTLPILMFVMPGGVRDRFKHALFAGYSLSFMLFLIALFQTFLAFRIEAIYLAVPALLFGLLHLFIQTKNSYRLGFPKAFLVYCGVLVSIIIGVALFVILLFLLRLI